MGMNMEQLEAKIKEVSAVSMQKAIDNFQAELAGKSLDENKINELVAAKVKELEIDEGKKAATRAETMAIFEAAIASAESKGVAAPNGKDIFAKMLVSNLKEMDRTKATNYARIDKEAVLNMAKKIYPEEKALHGIMQKEMTAGVPSAGGFTIPQILIPDVIEYLYARGILPNLGVQKVPMVNGNFSMPRVDSTSAAYWVGETQQITDSDMGLGQVNLKSRKLAAATLVSNSLLRQNAGGLDALIARDLQRNAQIKLDAAFLYGAGTEYTPRGLKNVSGIQSTGSSLTALGLTTPIDMVALLEQANVPMDNVKWILSPLGKSWLAGKAFSSGPFAWAEEMARAKTLNGYEFLSSATVEKDSSSAYSDFWLIDAAQILWGVAYDLELEMSREASFYSGGTTKNAFQEDLTIVRVIGEHDFGVRQPKAVVYGQFSKA